MEELLLLVIQGLFELILEVFGSFPLDTMSYKREREERNWTILKCFFWWVPALEVYLYGYSHIPSSEARRFAMVTF